jgi:hypothetical protein
MSIFHFVLGPEPLLFSPELGWAGGCRLKEVAVFGTASVANFEK